MLQSSLATQAPVPVRQQQLQQLLLLCFEHLGAPRELPGFQVFQAVWMGRSFLIFATIYCCLDGWTDDLGGLFQPKRSSDLLLINLIPTLCCWLLLCSVTCCCYL